MQYLKQYIPCFCVDVLFIADATVHQLFLPITWFYLRWTNLFFFQASKQNLCFDLSSNQNHGRFIGTKCSTCDIRVGSHSVTYMYWNLITQCKRKTSDHGQGPAYNVLGRHQIVICSAQGPTTISGVSLLTDPWAYTILPGLVTIMGLWYTLITQKLNKYLSSCILI